MLLPALIVSATCACLLLLLNTVERAYLRHHAANQSRDLLAVQVEVSSIDLSFTGQDISPLLAETLAQDIFRDPLPEGTRRWPTRAVRRGDGTLQTNRPKG